MDQRYTITAVPWQTKLAQQSTMQLQVCDIRKLVFIQEQSVPAALEWDSDDAHAHHLLVTNAQGVPIACMRIVNQTSIGRMAVLKVWRGKGVGTALLKSAISYCQNHHTTIVQLSAQVHAINFYVKAGFVVTSEPYIEAGIWHVDMQLAQV